MKISVVIPTFRLGGLDLLKWSLDQQSFSHDEFELVLVDGLHKWRQPVVAEWAKAVKYRIVHVPPEPDENGAIFPRDCHPRCRNTGILYARGEVCVLCCDYIMATPYWLSLFWHRFQTIPGNFAVLGTHVYGDMFRQIVDPRLVKNEGKLSLDEYLALIESLGPRDRLWSTVFCFPPEEIFGLAQRGAFSVDLNRQDPKRSSKN